MGSLLSHLLKLDLLAPSVQLRIAGNTSSKSLVGVVLFLAYIAIALWTCYMQFLDFKDTTKPLIHTSNLISREYPEFDLRKENSLPILMGMINGVQFVKPEHLGAYFSLKLWVTYFSLNSTTGEYEMNLTDLPIVPCKLLLDSGELNRDFMKDMPKSYLEIIPEYGMCANTTGFDVTVVGSNTDRVSSNVEYAITPCSLPGGVGCKPAVEVNRMFIQTLNPYIATNMTSQENPVVTFYSPDDLFPLNVNNLQLFKYEMVKNEIKDYFGFLGKERDVASFATTITRPPRNVARNPSVISANAEDLFYLVTEPYVVISWVSGTKFNLIRRNYQGIIDLVSNIGGLNSLILAVISAVYLSVHQVLQRRLLVRKIFRVTTASPTWLNICLKKKASNRTAVENSGEAQKEMELGRSQHITTTSNSPYTIVSKEVFEEASKIIENDLDVVHICKQLHELRILVDLLLKKDQTELIPLATLCRHDSQRRKNPKSKIFKGSSLSIHGSQSNIKKSESSQIFGNLVASHEFASPQNEAPHSQTDRPNSVKGQNLVAAIEHSDKRLESQMTGSLGPKTTYNIMVEGLEDEFNKLIRTGLESGPGVGKDLPASGREQIHNLLKFALKSSLLTSADCEIKGPETELNTGRRSSDGLVDQQHSQLDTARANLKVASSQQTDRNFEVQHTKQSNSQSQGQEIVRQPQNTISTKPRAPPMPSMPRLLKLGKREIMVAKQP